MGCCDDFLTTQILVGFTLFDNNKLNLILMIQQAILPGNCFFYFISIHNKNAKALTTATVSHRSIQNEKLTYLNIKIFVIKFDITNFISVGANTKYDKD